MEREAEHGKNENEKTKGLPPPPARAGDTVARCSLLSRLLHLSLSFSDSRDAVLPLFNGCCAVLFFVVSLGEAVLDGA